MLSQLMLLFVPITMAALNTSAPRGEQVVKIPTSSGAAEICVIPKKYPNGAYTEKDVKAEQMLCGLVRSQNAALCPKLESTNPGILFFSVPEGMTGAQIEAKNCDVDEAKKVAKYKASTSCSYTPSILSYYHVSRILGGILQVPQAVIRTMDIKDHKRLAGKAVANLEAITAKSRRPNEKPLILQTWSGYNSSLIAGSESSKRDLLLTSDFTQSYGALQVNPRSEEKYTDMFFSAKAGQTRTEAFRDRSEIFGLLKDRKPLKSLVGNQFTVDHVQKVLLMQNAADMIVMDTLLNQQDRFGNIHYTAGYAYLDSANGMAVKLEKKMTPEDIRAKGAVAIKNMMLKDNDCGVSKSNAAKAAGLIGRISHMSPTTYSRLVSLQAAISQDATKAFFKEETLMTDTDYSSFKQNLNEVVQTLKGACKEGRLQLDLDLDGHFANKPLNQSCG